MKSHFLTKIFNMNFIEFAHNKGLVINVLRCFLKENLHFSEYSLTLHRQIRLNEFNRKTATNNRRINGIDFRKGYSIVNH